MKRSYFLLNTNSAFLSQLSSNAIMDQCFIGCSLGNKAEHSSNKAEPIIWLETLVTFVIIEYARTINSNVGATQIFQAISLIMKSKSVSINAENLCIYLTTIWLNMWVYTVSVNVKQSTIKNIYYVNMSPMKILKKYVNASRLICSNERGERVHIFPSGPCSHDIFLCTTGEMWPILAHKRDRNLRSHPSDTAGHSGASNVLCQDICTF